MAQNFGISGVKTRMRLPGLPFCLPSCAALQSGDLKPESHHSLRHRK